MQIYKYYAESQQLKSKNIQKIGLISMILLINKMFVSHFCTHTYIKIHRCINLMEILKVYALALIQKETDVLNVGNFCRKPTDFLKALFWRHKLSFFMTLYYC